METEEFLARRYYGGDLPAAAERALHACALDWHDEAMAEAHIQDALRLAGDHLAVRIGAYKFYFYRHRLPEALPHAEACLNDALRRLGLPPDWRAVTAESADFSDDNGDGRLFLFALQAWGYCAIRLGRFDEGRPALEKVAVLDPADRIGAASVLKALNRREAGEEE